jgi:hypothetical protein
MITSPTSGQLLESVRDELRTKIKSVITDPEALGVLAMIDSILASVAVRSDHEVAWMREEIADIERGAEAVISANADKTGRVSDALKALHTSRSPSDHVTDLNAEYRLAGEILSCSIEAAMTAGGELRDSVTGILARRTAREVHIRGEFSLAGRV